MKLLIRFIETRGRSEEVQERSFEGDSATIGRGTDQTIPIADRRLPLKYATLSIDQEHLAIRTTGELGMLVNDAPSRRARLKPGDVVNILGHRLEVGEGKDRADFTVTFRLQTQSVTRLRDRFKTRLWQVGFPQRSLSWLLFLTILAFGLLIPAAGLLVGMDKLRDLPLTDDSIWSSGELHPTHAFMGSNCSYCHAIPFVKARDEECLVCHLSVTHHFDTSKLGRDYAIGDTCGDCHREHSGTTALTRSDQTVCTVCHADLAQIGFPSERLRRATDFMDDHPSFRVSLLAMDDDRTWDYQRVDLWDDEVEEKSNLKFGHDIHLAEDGIAGPEGTVHLVCENCHETEKGGLRMKTVTMEKHCASCHQLTFDPLVPDHVVAHGSPPKLMQALREYYAFQFVNNNQGADTRAMLTASSTFREARLPRARRGTRVINDLVDPATSVPLTAQALAYVEEHTMEAAKNLFERQTCTVCHEVAFDESQEVPWQILPVRLTPDFFPLAEFSHDSHKNMRCDGCHDALWSRSASDILMPDIGTCRTCHGGEHTGGRLQSSCIACHKFHLDGQRPMGALVAIDDEGNLIDTRGNIVDEAGNIMVPVGEIHQGDAATPADDAEEPGPDEPPDDEQDPSSP